MELVSPAFEHHHTIPKKYTCEGENLSPPLVLSNVPMGTQSIALIMDDPDAPSGTFDHWIVWNIAKNTTQLKEGQKGLTEGKNHFGKVGYGGPCPPRGPAHRYFFKLYALDTAIDLPAESEKEQLLSAMNGHVLETAELVGTYSRS